MTVQATVRINEQVWSVALARTQSEIAAGLGGVANIPAQTGMLFDMGAGQYQVRVNMQAMLFDLDIAFMTQDGYILEVKRNVAIGTDSDFEIVGGPGARYFLEVNADELIDVAAGDTAVIDAEEPPSSVPTDIISVVMPLMIVMMMMGMVMTEMVKTD